MSEIERDLHRRQRKEMSEVERDLHRRQRKEMSERASDQIAGHLD